jgi:pimeloyl-ACP methyl ester carboxylesterase
MATFVLVHGAWHGGWCFEKLIPVLRAAGHQVLAPDLPGHGSDATPAREVTLASCVARVGETLARASEPAVLLGHSMGGVIITQAGEEYAPQLRSLVYLAAFLPVSGERLASFRAASAVTDLLSTDHEAGVVHLDVSGARQAFYHDCEDADVSAAIARLRPQPIAPWTTRVTLGPRFAALPRHYVECTQDRAIPLELQRRMHAASPCRVHTLESSHSPFYAMPERLAALLDAIARG